MHHTRAAAHKAPPQVPPPCPDPALTQLLPEQDALSLKGTVTSA